jgi:Uma2 family endonuclease
MTQKGNPMVLEIPLRSPSIQTPTVTWEILPADYVLPDDPVENIQQPILAAALTDALGEAGYINAHMLIASNFGLVATVNQKTVVKAPDWLYIQQVVPASGGVVRRSYTPKAEGDSVAVVMEFLSETDTGEYSIRPTYPYGKLYFYERILCVPAYVIFDPHNLTLEVRRLEGSGTNPEGKRYVLQEPTAEGRYWIPEMELFLGMWYGTRLGSEIHWLRWWDRNGNMLLWGSERAEQERQRAEQERQRAEQERQRAEKESQRAEAFAAKLRELGVDPENL